MKDYETLLAEYRAEYRQAEAAHDDAYDKYVDAEDLRNEAWDKLLAAETAYKTFKKESNK